MKILILAPHQDDEILACYGVIKKAILNSDEVKVVFATNGDFYGRYMAHIRALESIKALTSIGVKRKNIIFLGYGDTGMPHDKSFLYRLYLENDENKSFYSNVSQTTYHPLTNNFEVMPYSKHNFIKTLSDNIMDYLPDRIYCSDICDIHGDHIALFLFLKLCLERNNLKLPVYTYIIHSNDHQNWPDRKSELFSKPDNISDEAWENRISVPLLEVSEKRKIIELFQSQISTSGFLLSFAKKEEIFYRRI